MRRSAAQGSGTGACCGRVVYSTRIRILLRPAPGRNNLRGPLAEPGRDGRCAKRHVEGGCRVHESYMVRQAMPHKLGGRPPSKATQASDWPYGPSRCGHSSFPAAIPHLNDTGTGTRSKEVAPTPCCASQGACTESVQNTGTWRGTRAESIDRTRGEARFIVASAKCVS